MNVDRHSVPVAIVGAGPYGLSLGAYLRYYGIPFRIFGQPMHSWTHHMPAGMYLKSEGFASTFYAPDRGSTLEAFCSEKRIPYGHIGLPVSLDTLVSYGVAFQKRFVPHLESTTVEQIDRDGRHFTLRLHDGETLAATHVVLATGITHFRYMPAVLASLGARYVSHSSDHRDLRRFSGQDVAVVGRGASALDIAALLADVGARPHVVARHADVRFGTPPERDRPLWKRLRYPQSRLGVGWKLYLHERAQLFHRLPQTTRHRILATTLGPAGGWAMRDRVVGRVPMMLGYSVAGAAVRDGRVELTLTNGGEEAPVQLRTDHVIAATGYVVDLDRLTFLDERVRARVRVSNDMPVLSPRFESTVPGLHFVGLPAATSFGPSMRFIAGAEYPARALTKHFAREIQ